MRRLIPFLALAVLGGCTCGRPPPSTHRGANVVVVEPSEVGRAAAVAEREPNDSRRQAQAVAADQPVAGTLARQGGTEDEDWYRVEVGSQGQVLSATLSGLPGADLVLEAFSAKGKKLVSVNNAAEGEGERLANLSVEGGTYYLRVRAKGGAAQGQPGDGGPGQGASYRLSWAVRAREEGEEREPNGRSAEASPLLVGEEAIGHLGWRGDADWYETPLRDVGPAARLSVELSGLDGVRLHLAVRRGDGTVVQERSGGVGEGVALPNLGLPAGTERLLVVVRARQGYSVEGRYTLRVATTVPAVPTESEPNDRPASAGALVPGQPVVGNLPDAADRDLFSVPVTQPSLLRIWVYPAPQLDVALAALDAGGQRVVAVDDGKLGDPEALSGILVQPPRALVELRAVRRAETEGAAPYRIVARLLPPDGWEQEPNDVPERATLWPSAQTEMRGFLHPRKDVDHYRVVAGDGPVTVDVTAPKDQPAKLELLDGNGVAVAVAGPPDGQGVSRVSSQAASGTSLVVRVQPRGEAPRGRQVYVLKRE